MCRNPTLRLGANGADEIKSHPFFNGVDWEKFKLKTATGEFDNQRACWFMPERQALKIKKKMKQEALNALEEINEDAESRKNQRDYKEWDYRS